MTEDGLTALHSKRKGSGGARTMPPARHKAPPRKSSPAPIEPTRPVNHEPPPASPPEPAQQSRPAVAVSRTPKPARERGRHVAPSTIYFDEQTDEWLEEAAIAGRRGRPKIDSRSAFARLAVRRLMEDMTPEQAVELLRHESQAAGGDTGGRPLR